MISIRSISKTFNPGTGSEVKALSDVSLEIAAGEFVVLLGSNGSGKSTLLNAVAGSVIHDSGTIVVDGHDITTFPEYKRSKWISRVFQDPMAGTAPDLSIVDNFRLASLRTSNKGLTLGVNGTFKEFVKDQLATLGLGLENKLLNPVGSLSGGQRQAITLLMAAMDGSVVMLLDEPTAALDPKTADQVMLLTEKLIMEHGITAILVTHNLKDAVQYGSRIVLMSEGKIERNIDKKNVVVKSSAELLSWF
jgi:putative tryptophan/tyrosine transport system ATP-binding protein